MLADHRQHNKRIRIAVDRARKQRLVVDEVVADVLVLLENLARLEHLRDVGEIGRIRERYGWTL